MKKRLGTWFLLVAKRLNPDITVKNFKAVEGYEPKKLGLSFEIRKQDIRLLRDAKGLDEQSSRKKIVEDAKCRIVNSILDGVVSKNLIEFDVRKKGVGYIITGSLNVYVPQSDCSGK